MIAPTSSTKKEVEVDRKEKKEEKVAGEKRLYSNPLSQLTRKRTHVLGVLPHFNFTANGKAKISTRSTDQVYIFGVRVLHCFRKR
jgi:hypothetical protein